MRPRTKLSGFDQELLRAIDQATTLRGPASSLFAVAVCRAGLDYCWAHYRLGVLEELGYVEVDRVGPGLPLLMRTL